MTMYVVVAIMKEVFMHNSVIGKLKTLKWFGFLKEFQYLQDTVDSRTLTTEEILERLLDSEIAAQKQRRQIRLMRAAKLKDSTACVENIDYTTHRGLERAVFYPLVKCTWLHKCQHVIITGLTGVGKTYLACALAQLAVRKDFRVLYVRLPRLLEELELAHADGSLPNLRKKLSKVQLLVLDDWGVNPLSTRNRQDLLELVEDKTETGSIIITSQLPINKWHDWIAEPTIADAILDRLVHRAHKFELHGESLRKRYSLEENTNESH